MSQTSIFMKAGGYYSANTQGAKLVIDRAGHHVLSRLSRMTSAQLERPFSIVDFGAADGGTSLNLMNKIVDELRNSNPQREVLITYTDLPHNDFSSLFKLLHNSPQDESYLKRHENVFAFCSGTSFYDQAVASDSVDIGFSATAMHWLSGLPCDISNHIHAVGASGDEFKAFRNFALTDWENILLNRSRELVAGGLLVMANFCIDEQGRYLGNTGDVNMFDTFNALWKRLVETGVITEQEYHSTAFPQFYKTIDDFRAPFDDPHSAVSKSGLRLQEIYTDITKCPYRAQFDLDSQADAFADAYVPTLRSWSESVFLGALDSSRPVEQRRKIVDDFYASYNELVRQEPSRHSMDYVHAYMVVVKDL